MSSISLGWPEFSKAVEGIARNIAELEHNGELFPKAILTSPLGGLPLAVALSHVLKIPAYMAQFNKVGSTRRLQGMTIVNVIPLSKHIMPFNFSNGIIFVDDIIDTGQTALTILKSKHGPKIDAIYVWIIKGDSPKVLAGLHVEHYKNIGGFEWASFPWEGDYGIVTSRPTKA